MTGKLLAISAIETFAFMTLAFLVGRVRQRIDTVDISWGLGYVIVAWTVALFYPTGRSLLVALLVSVWGLRLSGHIWQRTKFRGDDPRYRELSRKWKGNFWVRAYFSIFLLQGFLVWVISLPIILLANEKHQDFEWLVIVGTIIWLFGFVFEAIADRQLQTFLRNQDRPKVLQAGLWRYSRHPNYFGELTQWYGIAVMALSVAYGWIGLISPLLLTYLIVFISGLPPIENRHKNDKDYQAYKKRTSALVPLPPRT